MASGIPQIHELNVFMKDERREERVGKSVLYLASFKLENCSTEV
jgi:hypothetical protein